MFVCVSVLLEMMANGLGGLKKYGHGTFPKVPLSLQAGRVTKAEQLPHPATHLPKQMMIRREARTPPCAIGLVYNDTDF